MHEQVGEPLDANTNRAVAHVGSARLLDRVVVDVDDVVEVAGDDLRDLKQLVVVESILPRRAVPLLGEGLQGDRGQVAAKSSFFRQKILIFC